MRQARRLEAGSNHLVPDTWWRSVNIGQTSHRRAGGLITLAVAAVLSVSCGGGGSSSSSTSPTPTPPSSSVTNVSGAWRGTATDSSGPGQMTWQLTQADTAVSGTAVMADTATGRAGRGSITGTLSGSAIHFTISVPAGGFDSPFGTCTASVTGDGQTSSSSITGTYSGSNSCSGTIASGQFALSKQ